MIAYASASTSCFQDLGFPTIHCDADAAASAHGSGVNVHVTFAATASFTVSGSSSNPQHGRLTGSCDGSTSCDTPVATKEFSRVTVNGNTGQSFCVTGRVLVQNTATATAITTVFDDASADVQDEGCY